LSEKYQLIESMLNIFCTLCVRLSPHSRTGDTLLNLWSFVLWTLCSTVRVIQDGVNVSSYVQSNDLKNLCWTDMRIKYVRNVRFSREPRKNPVKASFDLWGKTRSLVIILKQI